MAIYKYQKKTKSGEVDCYMVVAEAINKFTGRRVQKKKRGIPSKPKAEKVYRELWNQCFNDKPNIPKPKTWGELIDLYKAFTEKKVRNHKNLDGISPKAFEIKVSYLNRDFGWHNLHPKLVMPHFVLSTLDKLQVDKKISRLTYRKIISLIKEVFQLAVEIGIYDHNPFRDVKVKKPRTSIKKVALTHEEASLLLTKAKKEDHPYYFVWALALATGMRRSELAGLKWTDIDFNTGLIHVQRQNIPGEGVVDKTKNGKDRIVALPKNFIGLLKSEKLHSNGPFIINLNCTYWTTGRQSKITKDFCRKIGIKEITFHQLRATHITLAIVDNISLGIIKENVGHSKLSTTDIYFRSSGINMAGQTDGLKLKPPKDDDCDVISINAK